MVTDIVDTHLGQARCRFGRYIHHSRKKSTTGRKDREKREEPDCHLCDAWPRRPFLWGEHNSAAIPERSVRGPTGCNQRHAAPSLICRLRVILEFTVSWANRRTPYHC